MLIAALTAVAALAGSPAAGASVPLQGSQVDLATGSAGRIQSPVDNSYAGAAVPVGDVNGDGVADMAFAEQRANTDAGRVVVVLGGPEPPAFTSPQVGSRGFVIAGRPGSRLGQVAAAGDVNGDGIDDLVLGAPSDSTAGSGAGAAFVVFGTRATADVDLSALGGRGFAIEGDDNDFLGASVTGVGDLNGDGRAELAIGGYCAGSGSSCGPGEAYVVFGRPGTATVAVHAPGFASQGFMIHDSTGVAAGQFGATVTGLGDFNGDGARDIGVYATSNGAPQYLRSAWVVFGKGTTGTVDVASGGAVRIDPPTPASPTPDVQTGAVYDAGDVNGDGRADVITAVPADPALGRTNAGAAVVVYGRPGTTTINPLVLGAGGFRIEGAVAGDYLQPLGSSADLDGDGRRELLLSAAAADNRGRADSGSVWTIAAVPPPLGVAYDLLFPPSGARQIDGAAAGDYLSTARGVGDVNGDGRPDLTVGGYGTGGTFRGASDLLLGFGAPAVQYAGVTGTAGSAIAPVAPTGVRRTGTPSFAATGLPAGLAVDAATGVISGTPQTAASGSASVTMTDLAGSVTASVPLSIGAAPAPPPSQGGTRPPFSVTTAFRLPATSRCLRRPVRLTLTFRRPRGITIDRVEALIGKKRLLRRTGAAARRTITITGLPARKFKLTVRVTPRGGRTVAVTRTYKVCPKKR